MVSDIKVAFAFTSMSFTLDELEELLTCMDAAIAEGGTFPGAQVHVWRMLRGRINDEINHRTRILKAQEKAK